MPVIPCPTPQPRPVRGIVQFDPVEFVALYPQFAGLSNPTMVQAFAIATILLNNTCCSAVQDANERLQLLYMITGHVLIINAGTNDGAGNVTPPQGMVGRINSAAEGSVSVTSEYSSTVGESEAFFIQTPLGAMFWQASAYLRSMLYVGPPTCGPNGPGLEASFGFGGDF